MPSNWVGVYGTTAGAFLAVGVFLVSVIGVITLPTDEADYLEDSMWRITYAFPMVIILFQLV